MPDRIEDVIDEEGKVSLPFINEVQAAGLAASELERNIRQIYLDQDIYRNITVNVVVPTRSYFILGEVRAAGRFQIMSATRVSQAIAAAGGYTEYASGKVQVKRQGAIVKVIKDAVGNTLQDGDTVTVIKDLKVKGSSLVVKVGTKVKNIRLVEGDHRDVRSHSRPSLRFLGRCSGAVRVLGPDHADRAAGVGDQPL